MSESTAQHVDPTESTVPKPLAEDATTGDVNEVPVAPTENSVSVESSEPKKDIESILAARRAHLEAVRAAITSHAATPAALKAAQQRHVQASKDAAELDRRKAHIMPEYDAIRQNGRDASVREEAAKLKHDIQDHENRLDAAQEAAAQLDAQLSDVSRTYKESAERSRRAFSQCAELVASLESAVNAKISSTTNPAEQQNIADDGTDGALAYGALQDVGDAVLARGQAHLTVQKILRDQHHMRNINSERRDAVAAAGSGASSALYERKDETIREAVVRFQDERARMQRDIEDMKRVHKEQTAALKAGEVRAKAEVIGSIGPKTRPSTIPKVEQEVLNAQAQLLGDCNATLKAQLHDSAEANRAGTKTKASLLQEEKTLTLRLKNDAEAHEAELVKIATRTHDATVRTQRIDKEASKLADEVQAMSAQVSRLHKASLTKDNKTQLLPPAQ